MRRGQYPNPTFLNKAEGIRKKRHTKIVAAAAVLVFIVLFVLFIRTGAKLERLYEQEYPDLVGAATAVTTEHSEAVPVLEPVLTTETTEQAVPTETQEELVPIIHTEPTAETIDVTDLSATPFEEPEPFYFRTSYPLQTISHEQRDVLLDVLKQNVLDYINNTAGERICFRYINLDTGETLGINDLEPIVPAGAFALPIEMTYWHRVDMGFSSPDYIITYDGTQVPGHSSTINEIYPPGKMFYLRTLANLAITDNDDYALSVILDRSNGIETVWNYLSTISGYVNFTENATYRDFQNSLMRGPGRTSCYDMAAYAERLYYNYLSQPDVYQPLINDLAYNPIRSPFSTSFGEDVPVLHVMGRNETFNAYTEVAIIDASEPIALIVYCECVSLDRAQMIQADLSGYVANFLNACHTDNPS